MGMWHRVPTRGPKPTQGEMAPIPAGDVGILPPARTQKGQGEKEGTSLCPPPRGTETPLSPQGVVREQHPHPPSTSREPWARAGGLQGAGRSPRESGEGAGSQAAPGLVPLCPLPINHPSATVRPQRLRLLPADGFGSAASPLPPPPPPVCEIKVKKK